MALRQPLSKTTVHQPSTISAELRQYGGDNILNLLSSMTTEQPKERQNAIKETESLLLSCKELCDNYPKEVHKLMTIPIRGQIQPEDPMLKEYAEQTGSCLVATLKKAKENKWSPLALSELHGLVHRKNTLAMIKTSQEKDKGSGPAAGKSSKSNAEKIVQRSPMETNNAESDEEKKKIPMPQELSKSIFGGREFAHMPMIEYQQLIRRLESQQRDIQELTSRLSRFASAQVTQGNPNIADLSDKNRPTKIGEKFGSLYDDEWSEAFESFKSVFGIHSEDEEPKIIYELVKVVQYAQEFCEKVAKEQLDNLVNNMKIPVLDPTCTTTRNESTEKCNENKGLQGISTKYAMNYRKECALHSAPAVSKLFKNGRLPEVCPWAKNQYPETIHKYVDKCTELTWLMCVQDPPMCLVWPKQGDKMQTNLYAYYGRKGKFIDTVVWPAVLLHNDGPIVSKGYVIPK